MLDILSSVIAMAWMYQLFIEGWGDPSYYTSASWLLASDPMVCGIVACMVQLFFAWRLHIISKKPLLTAFIVTASVATLAGGVGTGIAVLWVREYALLGRVKAIGCTWDFSAVIADVTITIGMTYYLRRHKGSFDSTDHLLDRIIQLTLQNGLLTCVLTAFQALTFLIPKLYSNSVLSSLNSRKHLRALGKPSDELGGISRGYHSTHSAHGETGTRHAEVVFVEIHEMTDSESTRVNDSKSQLQPQDM
ncbi:hypothetical protein HWV62_7535 [Athelia sp. TMB]|nr:hypothetical protein HWV62_7535 [Athelia sp. TMB]